MKNLKRIVWIIVILLVAGFFTAKVAGAQTVLKPFQGGTGKGTATAGNVGDCLTVSDDSPFTYAFDTCGGAGFDSTAVDATTWSDGLNASNVWTFDLSGTDTTLTFGSDLFTFNGGLTITTGNNFILGTTQWNSADKIDGEVIADDTIDDDSIDFADVTLADITFDVGSVDTTEFGYLNGVTSAIQTQINTKVTDGCTDCLNATEIEDIYLLNSGDTSTGLLIAGANFTVGNGATTAGVLTLLEDTDAGANFASFQVPALTADTVYVLPADDGDATEQLTTDGAGNLTWEAAGSGSGAPSDADYLVGTANGGLSAEIVVGTSPGGELGGTWASPTLDDSVTTTGWVMGTFSGTTLTAGTVNIDLLDGVGAVDMDYGSVDITDHTFTTDGGVVVIDGNITQDAGTTLFMGGLLDATGAVDMDYGSADITDHTFITDGTGDAEIVLPAGSIGDAEVANNITVDLATLATTVTVSDAGEDTTTFPLLAIDATGSLGPRTDAGLSYQGTTNALTATTFIGALTGNASTATALAADPTDCATSTHFAVGIIASGVATCEAIADADVPNTITIDLATLASTVTVVDGTDATSFVGIYDSATGSLAPKTDGALLYAADTGTLQTPITIATTRYAADADDGTVLGAAGTAFSDLFLAETGVINWDSSDMTLTQSGDTLTVGGGDFFVADGQGAVIGHTAQLVVAGITPEFQITGTSTTGVDSSLVTNNFSTTATSAAIHIFNKSDQATPGSFALLDSGDTIGGLLWTADDGVDYTSEVARIYSYIDNTSGSNDMPGRLVFGTTADAGVAVTDRWIIDSVGTFKPATDAANDIGTTTLGVNNMHFDTGAVINFENGNATLTHSTGLLTSNVDFVVPAEAYAVGWNGSNEAPTKNDVYDKIETLSSPTAVTLTPQPNYPSFAAATVTWSTNTTGYVAQMVLPAAITVNKISFNIDSTPTDGTVDIVVYSENGQTKEIDVTTATLSALGLYTTAVSAVTLNAGVHYVMIIPNSTTNVTAYAYPVGTGADLLNPVTSEPKQYGTLTVTAGTPPATFTPSSITDSTNGILPYLRFDN